MVFPFIEIYYPFSDHVSSAPTVVFPIKEISELCHKANALVLVNGVHGPGHVPTHVASLNPDFYLGIIFYSGFHSNIKFYLLYYDYN